MTLPQDPYEATTVQLIEADSGKLQEWEAKRQEAEEQVRRLRERIAAYDLALQGYRSHRPRLSQNGVAGPYVDEAKVASELVGLTLLQKLIKLSLMNERTLYVNKCAKLMHRIGAIGGQWTNIPPRLYTLIGSNPEIFNHVSAGEYELLPGAENHLTKKGSD